MQLNAFYLHNLISIELLLEFTLCRLFTLRSAMLGSCQLLNITSYCGTFSAIERRNEFKVFQDFLSRLNSRSTNTEDCG